MEFDCFEEDLFLCTTPVEVLGVEVPQHDGGTGFLVLWPMPDGRDESAIYLVTCRHLLMEGRGLIKIILHYKDVNERGQTVFGKAIHGPEPYDQTYFGHPDPDIDLACVNMSQSVVAMDGTAHLKYFIVDNVFNPRRDGIVPTMPVYFVGYPHGFYDMEHNLPILRAGVVATIPRVDFNGRPVFLIDAQALPNSSGSPVVVRTNGKLRLIGVLARGLGSWGKIARPTIDDDGNETLDEDPGKAKVWLHSGIGEVIKHHLLVEMLDAAVRRLADRNPPSSVTPKRGPAGC